MSSETLLYIILSGIIALLLALFQYWYKVKKSRLNTFFTFLRFLTYFAILLLIINPKLDKTTYYNQKPNLVIAVDNSNSIAHLKQDKKVLNLINTIDNSANLKEKFNIDYYTFSDDIRAEDSVTFKAKNTNIAKALSSLKQLYNNTVSPILLITDGNQTIGNDYELLSRKYNQSIIPIILGDTVTYSDLKIDQLNVNRYAYLNNQFPVEVFLVYNGTKPVNTSFQILSSNNVIYSKAVEFSKQNNSVVLNFTLPANSVGVKSYKARIVPVNSEKNTINNTKEFAVDVINKKTNVAIVSDIIHPDLGALKKSIESNKQSSVSILNPKEYILKTNDYQSIIIYQPNKNFKSVFDYIKKSNTNAFIVTGLQTDWNLLNSVQKDFSKKVSNINEDYQASLNTNYSTFIVDNLNFESFPPLQDFFEDTQFNTKTDNLLYKSVNGFDTQQPLLITFESNNTRKAALFGEGIWKWRAQNFINEQSFEKFDDFIGKIIQYISTKTNKKRLNINFESFYNSSDNIVITAQYFNKNFEFDPRASLSIIVKDKENSTSKEFPFVIKNNAYQVDLSSLPASEYSFTVIIDNEPITQSGSFKILEYNVEQQFLNANVTKLEQVATNTKGTYYFIDNTSQLFSNLLSDNQFQTVQVANKNTAPLIDFKWLLVLIVLSLSSEWFLRKYNGLI